MNKMINNIVKELKKKEDIRNFYRLAAKYGFYKGNPVVESRSVNVETARAFEQAHTGIGLKTFDTVEELVLELNTPD